MPYMNVAGVSHAAGGPGDGFYACQPFGERDLAFLLFEGCTSFWNETMGKAARELHAAFHAAFAEQPPDLGVWMCSMNERLQFVEGYFCSVFVGAIHLPRQELEFVNAGYGSALLRHTRTHEVETLPSNFPLLGVVKRRTATVSRTTLQPGDMLLLANEGVADMVGEDRTRFREEAIADFLREDAPTDSSARGWLRLLFQRLDVHGNSQGDAPAALALRMVDDPA